MNTQKLFILIVGVCIIGVGVFTIYTKMQSEIKPQPQSEQTGEPAVTIVRTINGYEPRDVTIKKGQIVLWKNESKDYHWPASDLHPTHGIYPEFDPLRPIAPGAEWKFKFDRVGKWNFHDHIRANKTGTVTVTE